MKILFLIIIVVAVLFFVVYSYDKKKINQSSTTPWQPRENKSPVANPQQDLNPYRSWDLATAIKLVESPGDCQRMISGICGLPVSASYDPAPANVSAIRSAGLADFSGTARGAMNTWWKQCSCEVVGKVCGPGFTKNKDLIMSSASSASNRLAQRFLGNYDGNWSKFSTCCGR